MGRRRELIRFGGAKGREDERMTATSTTCPDPACGAINRLPASYCRLCGGALADESLSQPFEGGSEVRSVGVAFGLWALCIVGVAGIHRFYAGRYVTGVLWLLTWGFAGIGSLVDLFLISGMVEEKNLELAALRSVMRSQVPTA